MAEIPTEILITPSRPSQFTECGTVHTLESSHDMFLEPKVTVLINS